MDSTTGIGRQTNIISIEQLKLDYLRKHKSLKRVLSKRCKHEKAKMDEQEGGMICVCGVFIEREVERKKDTIKKRDTFNNEVSG